MAIRQSAISGAVDTHISKYAYANIKSPNILGRLNHYCLIELPATIKKPTRYSH